MSWSKGLAACATVLWSVSAFAAEYPAPKTGEYVIRDFKFHTGDVMPELRVGYTTVGEPTGEPVVVLHGTTGSAGSMLTAVSRANCSVRASRSTRRNTSSSFRTRSGTADRRSRRTACARNSRSIITTTWWKRSIAS